MCPAPAYPLAVDEYQKEIADLEAQVEELVEADGDKNEIADLQMQAEILKALYAQAVELHEAGRADEHMRRALGLRGYGAWDLDNVYAFVYETSVELPDRGHSAFVNGIRDADFAAILVEPAPAAE